MAAALTVSGKGFNPFGRVWSAYERSLRKHPVLTQAATSAFLWGLGDAMAQRIENRGRGGIDARRVALTAAFGGAVIGPAGHGWYLMLERLVMHLGLACSLKSMLLKVTADNLLYSPCYVLAFFAYGCMAIDGLSPATFVEKMREEFMPTMLAEALLWPPYMALVFSRVPVEHQLLAVNVATLFDVCFLSWIRTKDDVAIKAEKSQSQQQQQHMLLQHELEQQGLDNRHGVRVGAKKAETEDNMMWNQQHQQQRQQEQVFGGPEWDFNEQLTSAKDMAAVTWPWGAAADDNLSRMALMAASATCSSAGSGSLFRLHVAAAPGPASASMPQSTPPPSTTATAVRSK